jgi:triacylglycerol lipase
MGVRDEQEGIGSWGRIPRLLRSYGTELYFGGTDGWGPYDINAEFLKERVEEILRATGAERVNIIAYSSGGLDSRYMIWKYGYGSKVASLTTISTPHQGSELADFVFSRKVLHTWFGRQVIGTLGKTNDDQRPDPYEFIRKITTEAMKDFNAQVVPDPQVYYLTIYSTMKGFWDDPLFGVFRWYVDREAGESDGVVSKESVQWYGETMDAGDKLSHLEMVDFYKSNRPGRDVLGIYMDILKRLADSGF